MVLALEVPTVQRERKDSETCSLVPAGHLPAGPSPGPSGEVLAERGGAGAKRSEKPGWVGRRVGQNTSVQVELSWLFLHQGYRGNTGPSGCSPTAHPHHPRQLGKENNSVWASRQWGTHGGERPIYGGGI